jgi:glycosyltransferase involved in cell wall biosynthesis
MAGGLPQAIIDRENGLLVPERDAAALAAAITHVLGSPERGRELGVRARQRIERDFSWSRTAEMMTVAYDRART